MTQITLYLCFGRDLGRRESEMSDFVPPESRRQIMKVKTVSHAGDTTQ